MCVSHTVAWFWEVQFALVDFGCERLEYSQKVILGMEIWQVCFRHSCHVWSGVVGSGEMCLVYACSTLVGLGAT